MTITLHNAACFDGFPTIAAASVDLVCADIPYGTTQCGWDSVQDLQVMRQQLYRIAKPEAAIVLFSAQPFTSILVSSNVRDWRSEWIWGKGNATGFLNRIPQCQKNLSGRMKISRCSIAASRLISRSSPTGIRARPASGTPSIRSATGKLLHRLNTTQPVGTRVMFSSSRAISRPATTIPHRSRWRW